MKLINFRLNICLGFIVLLFLALIMLLISLNDNETQPTNVAIRTRRLPLTRRNTTYIHRVLYRPTYRPLRKLNQPKETTWQNILKGVPLRVGSSYSQGRTNVPYILGVPTVHRAGENYLLESLARLIDNMNDHNRQNSLIVVYIGETNSALVKEIWQGISEYFGEYLDDGLIDVITPPENYYPDFENLFPTLHDNPERARWRTKQTLDYMYLMTYAQSRGSYYLQLEDDIIPTKDYFNYIVNLADLHTNFRLGHLRNWIVISFCDLGFIGKLFHTTELRQFLSYVKIFFNDQPIDWLLQSYVKLRCCRWDGFEMADCKRDYSLYFIRADQSQFQHEGMISSLNNKEQLLRDKRFNRVTGVQRMNHLRQPFYWISSHKSTTLNEKLQLREGETFIWGYMPQEFSLMRYMRDHQYDKVQFKIRNGPHNDEKFAELIVDVVNQMPTISLDSNESKRCGFLLSYTSMGRFDPPSVTYFYVKDNDTDVGETSWFRRFVWSNLF